MILLERAGRGSMGTRWSICMTKPWTAVTVLNICADNADGGPPVIARHAESGGDLHQPAAQPPGRKSGRKSRDTARISKGRRAFEMLSRSPPT